MVESGIMELLVDARIPVAVPRHALDPEQAARCADELGGPVVLKAGGLRHKSDDGGVILDVRSAEQARAAASELLDRLGDRALPLLVQRQHTGHELLVGLRREPGVGAVVVVGSGGIHAEVHADAVAALVPLDRDGASALLRRMPGYPLLAGHRGSPALDTGAVVEVLVAASGLAEAHPEIGELDLNPVLVGPAGEGAIAVDARMALLDAAPRPRYRATGLDRLLRPRNVAVVGVSDEPTKLGARIYRYLTAHGFRGQVYAVHLASGQVDGRPRYRRLAELPEVPDLVSIAVPASAVPAVSREAVELGVGAAVVHSSGFAEVGGDGAGRQEELAALFAGAGIPLAGPNCMGVVSPASGLAASLSGALEADELRAGNVALLAGSGALGSCVASRLMGDGIGLSRWVHLGNEAGLDAADYLEWLADDPETAVVGMLVENIVDGQRLVRAGRRLAASGKPLFTYNLVRGDGARAVTLSHTGAMVGSHRVRSAVLDAAGAVQVPTLQVLQDAIAFAATSGLPHGDRLLAVAASGGACAIIADEADAAGIELPQFPPGARERAASVLPDFVPAKNPLDVSAQIIARPEVLGEVLDAVLDDAVYDAALIQFTTNADPGAELTAKTVVALRQRAGVPIYVARYGAESLAPAAHAVYAAAGVPVLGAPDRAMAAVTAVTMAGRALNAARAERGA